MRYRAQMIRYIPFFGLMGCGLGLNEWTELELASLDSDRPVEVNGTYLGANAFEIDLTAYLEGSPENQLTDQCLGDVMIDVDQEFDPEVWGTSACDMTGSGESGLGSISGIVSTDGYIVGTIEVFLNNELVEEDWVGQIADARIAGEFSGELEVEIDEGLLIVEYDGSFSGSR